MAQPDDIKKVTNMMNYLEIVREIESVPNARSVSYQEPDCQESRNLDGTYTPPDMPYRWIMRAYHSPKFPSMTMESIDIQEESVFWVADEVWKSHIFNIRCAMEGMENKEAMVVWVDYDYHKMKNHPETQKIAVDKIDPDDAKRIKTRKYHYWKNNGFNLCLSPAVQAFRFERDTFIRRHGLELKIGNLPFTGLSRDVRYVQLDSKWIFEEEPFKSLEMSYFRNPSRMMGEDAKKRKMEEMAEYGELLKGDMTLMDQ